MARADHQRKKQFQQSISNYFRKETLSDRALTPELPAETQASLINVGMRVRKSVPEGYKTPKTVSYDAVSLRPVSSQPTLGRLHSQELMPFSGIHKTGGHAQQEVSTASTRDHWHLSAISQDHWSSSAPALLSKASFDSMPSLTTSQDTMCSEDISYRDEYQPNRKRSFEEEIEECMDDIFDEMEKEEADISARIIAQPRSSKGKMLTAQDNSEDFSDAHFLQLDDHMADEYF